MASGNIHNEYAGGNTGELDIGIGQSQWSVDYGGTGDVARHAVKVLRARCIAVEELNDVRYKLLTCL
jgi:hypothetical protein